MGAPTPLPFLGIVSAALVGAPDGVRRHKSHLPGDLPGGGGIGYVTVTAVVGAQFGDEAKGKISDYLAAHARYVVRSGGGPNAGHSIHLPDGSVVLHQLSVGVLRAGTVGVSGPGMVLNPMTLEDEIRDVQSKHLFRGELMISERAHVILPLHAREDAWEEALRSKSSPAGGLGTTGRGIGPAYSDRYGRWGIRFADLVRPKLLAERLALSYASKAHVPDLPPEAELLVQLSEVGGRLAPYVRATEPVLWEALAHGESILIEGAQSALLDVDFGTYPYVTSSHPTSAGALVGSGIPPQELDEVVGVAKAYCTRVGAGPFPTEASEDVANYLREKGGERGATTGRPRRCGWLDMVLLKYAYPAQWLHLPRRHEGGRPRGAGRGAGCRGLRDPVGRTTYRLSARGRAGAGAGRPRVPHVPRLAGVHDPPEGEDPPGRGPCHPGGAPQVPVVPDRGDRCAGRMDQLRRRSRGDAVARPRDQRSDPCPPALGLDPLTARREARDRDASRRSPALRLSGRRRYSRAGSSPTTPAGPDRRPSRASSPWSVSWERASVRSLPSRFSPPCPSPRSWSRGSWDSRS